MNSSPSYYILVASDTDKNRLFKPSALDVAKYRLGRCEWGIGIRTRNRNTIKPGDMVLIYISGKRDLGKHFIAHAIVRSKATPVSGKMIAEVDAPRKNGIVLAELSIKLSTANFLKSPVAIKLIKGDLSFVTNPNSNRWGTFLQGGCMKITEKDYNFILSIGR